MPSFDGFGAWIKFGRTRREEFKTVTDMHERSTVCHIISETGQTFTVHWQVPSGAADYCVNLYLDGEYVDGRVDPADLGKRSGGSFKDVWLNERFIGLLAFREPTFGFAIEGDDIRGSNAYHAPNRGPLIKADCPLAKEIGTVHIEIIQVEIQESDSDSDSDSDGTDEGDAGRREDLGNDALPEAKSMLLTHTSGYHKKEIARKRPDKCRYEFSGEPLTSFTFIYRSKDFLEAAGILSNARSDNCRSSQRLRKQEPVLRREEKPGSVRRPAGEKIPLPAKIMTAKEIEEVRLQLQQYLHGAQAVTEQRRMRIEKKRLAIVDQTRRLEMEERLLEEQQNWIENNSTEDHKPVVHRALAIRKKSYLTNSDGAIDLTGDSD